MQDGYGIRTGWMQQSPCLYPATRVLLSFEHTVPGILTAEDAKGAEELGHTAAVAVLRGDRHTSTSTQNDAVEEEEELSFFTPPARRRRSE